jgi:Family of unknown function (DUF6049)
VKVKLQVSTGQGVTVSPQHAVIIPAGQEEIVKLAVKATSVGSTTLRLSLLSSDGTPVPGAQATMTVQATHYGTFALVIIATALAVFLLTVATRAVRRGQRRRREGRPGQAEPGEQNGPGGPEPAPGPDAGGHDAGEMAARPQDPGPAPPEAGPVPDDSETDQPDRPEEPAVTDSVASGHPDPGHASHHDPAEETDDYAWSPGWTDRR